MTSSKFTLFDLTAKEVPGPECLGDSVPTDHVPVRTRGKRGKTQGREWGDAPPAEYALRKEDTHSRGLSSQRRGRDKQARADRQKFKERGLKAGLLRRDARGLRGAKLRAAKVAIANRVRVNSVAPCQRARKFKRAFKAVFTEGEKRQGVAPRDAGDEKFQRAFNHWRRTGSIPMSPADLLEVVEYGETQSLPISARQLRSFRRALAGAVAATQPGSSSAPRLGTADGKTVPRLKTLTIRLAAPARVRNTRRTGEVRTALLRGGVHPNPGPWSKRPAVVSKGKAENKRKGAARRKADAEAHEEREAQKRAEVTTVAEQLKEAGGFSDEHARRLAEDACAMGLGPMVGTPGQGSSSQPATRPASTPAKPQGRKAPLSVQRTTSAPAPATTASPPAAPAAAPPAVSVTTPPDSPAIPEPQAPTPTPARAAVPVEEREEFAFPAQWARWAPAPLENPPPLRGGWLNTLLVGAGRIVQSLTLLHPILYQPHLPPLPPPARPPPPDEPPPPEEGAPPQKVIAPPAVLDGHVLTGQQAKAAFEVLGHRDVTVDCHVRCDAEVARKPGKVVGPDSRPVSHRGVKRTEADMRYIQVRGSCSPSWARTVRYAFVAASLCLASLLVVPRARLLATLSPLALAAAEWTYRKTRKDISFTYVPHALTCVLTEYPLAATVDVAAHSINQKLMTLATLPTRDDQSYAVSVGTQAAAQAVIATRDFQLAPTGLPWAR